MCILKTRRRLPPAACRHRSATPPSDSTPSTQRSPQPTPESWPQRHSLSPFTGSGHACYSLYLCYYIMIINIANIIVTVYLYLLFYLYV